MKRHEAMEKVAFGFGFGNINKNMNKQRRREGEMEDGPHPERPVGMRRSLEGTSRLVEKTASLPTKPSPLNPSAAPEPKPVPSGSAAPTTSYEPKIKTPAERLQERSQRQGNNVLDEIKHTVRGRLLRDSEPEKLAALRGKLGLATIGGALGAAHGYSGATREQKEENPYSEFSDRHQASRSAAATKGAIGAGLGLGAGIGLGALGKGARGAARIVKRASASDEIDRLYREASLKKPDAEGKKHILEEPSDYEPEKNMPENEVYALKDIDCEVCGYEGQPTEDGFCPSCGTLGGVKPTPPSEDKHTVPAVSRTEGIQDEDSWEMV